MKIFERRMEAIESKRQEQNSKPRVTYRFPKMINDIEEWSTKALAQQEAAKKAHEAKIKGDTP